MSRRVMFTSTMGFLGIAIIYLLTLSGMAGGGTELMSLLGNTVLAAFAAGISLAAAARIPRGERLRTRWLVIGLGISAWVFGQVVHVYYLTVLGRQAPFPGPADAFFVISSIAIAVGLIDAALGVRRFGSLNGPLLGATAVALALLAMSSGMLLKDVLFDDKLSALAKAVSLYQPLANIFLGVLPALFVVFALAVRGGKLGVPWIPVGGGVALIALSNTAYVWLAAQKLYTPGQVNDLALMIGYMLIAVGALLHMDVDAEDGAPAAIASAAAVPAEGAAEVVPDTV